MPSRMSSVNVYCAFSVRSDGPRPISKSAANAYLFRPASCVRCVPAPLTLNCGALAMRDLIVARPSPTCFFKRLCTMAASSSACWGGSPARGAVPTRVEQHRGSLCQQAAGPDSRWRPSCAPWILVAPHPDLDVPSESVEQPVEVGEAAEPRDFVFRDFRAEDDRAAEPARERVPLVIGDRRIEVGVLQRHQCERVHVEADGRLVGARHTRQIGGQRQERRRTAALRETGGHGIRARGVHRYRDARLDLFVDERLHVCRREQRQQLRIVA